MIPASAVTCGEDPVPITRAPGSLLSEKPAAFASAIACISRLRSFTWPALDVFPVGNEDAARNQRRDRAHHIVLVQVAGLGGRYRRSTM